MIDWKALTRMPNKARLYECETYFREGLSDVQELFGDQFAARLWRSTLLVVKPDAIATAKLTMIRAFLVEHDFRVVAVQPFHFDRFSGRELWRYQLTLATLDRLAANDCVLLGGPALLLVIVSESDHDVPASVRLSQLKGAADLRVQKPGTLRNRLGQRNRLCSMIHCADEPADLVRELGLLADAPTRQRLLMALVTRQLDEVDASVLNDALVRDAAGGRSFDSLACVQRVALAVQAICDRKPSKARPARAALEYLQQMKAGKMIPFRLFLRELREIGMEPQPWDLAILGSNFVVEDEVGAAKMLGSPEPSDWREKASAPSERCAPSNGART